MLAQKDERKSGESGESASQAALIAACQQGDYDAFAQLFALHKDRVYSIALRFSGDPAAAMDIAQDAFLKLLGQLRHFRGQARFETWLYRIVVNACLDHNRARRRWQPLLEDVISGVLAPLRDRFFGAERAQIASELRTQVDRAVATLPADQRIAVVLRYTEGLSYEEIADITAVAPGTVASRLSRAHTSLERKLHHWKGARP
jgi:RNA polymerase sigma-70 factor, ECF subfamily